MNFIADNLKKIWRQAATPEFLFVFIAVWAAVVMIGGIPHGDLSGWDDTAYAHEAKAMVQSGDFWTLRMNGVPDFDKPPLFIWLLAASFKIFGISDFAAKIPGVVLGWATIITVYFLTKELFRKDSEDFPDADSSIQTNWLPALAMLVMATTQYFLKYASHAMTDVPFAFFFTLAVYFYIRSLKNNLFLLASGALIGLATLTRSPMGLFPLGIIALHLVFLRRFKLLFSVHMIGCVTLSFAIPAIWFLQEYNLFGEVFVNRHFGNFLAHSASVSIAQPRTNLQQFLWYFEYLFLIVKLYLPWFPLMFYGLFLAVRKWRRRGGGETASAEILLIVWFVVVLVPFSLVDSKVLRYVLPVFPAFAVFAAYALGHLFSPKNLAKFSRIAVVLLAAAAFITTVFPNYLTRAGDMRSLAPISDAATAPDEKILLYTSGENKANFLTQLLWYGNRLCTFVKDINEVEIILSENKQTVVIMDKPSFADFAGQHKFQIEILGESENFVCFR